MKSWLLLSLLGFALSAFGQTDAWPKEIPIENGGKITVYQPQPERLAGGTLSFRGALSVRQKANAEPVFGALWSDAIVLDNGQTLEIESAKITHIQFPDSTITDVTAIEQKIEAQIPKWKLQLNKSDVMASIQQDQQNMTPNFKTDAPKIIYASKASTLVLIDGDPKIEKDKNINNMLRVMNTPFLIVQNPDDKKYYLYGGGFWYVSSSPLGDYTYVKSLPKTIKEMDKQIKEQEKKDKSKQEEQASTPTAIIISTEPAELIQTEGEPTYKPIQGTSLLFVDNTLDEIFKDVNSQLTFILISGRWYSAPSLSGPWTYVNADKLPTDFAKIPPGSEKDGVLSSVAGTEEAQDAIYDAQVPQTAKVDKKTAKCEVTYDGSPRFAQIENTNLKVAENSNITVMQAANGKYYALENGVWFISNNATGPWEVANERPQDVEKIPPSSPAYNTKYVYIYDNTPSYVYMGYTPGYLGSYYYMNTIVWGTGWYYRPWYGYYYYPRPCTWGFGMHYNPWMGWSMSFGFSAGWFSYRYAWGGGWYGGWFGPPAFRPPYRPWGWSGGYYRPGGPYYGYRPHVTVNRPVYVNHNRYVTNNRYARNNNVYRGSSGITTRDVSRRPVASTRPVGSTRPAPGNNNRLPGNNNRLPGNNNRLPGETSRPGTNPGNNNRLPPSNNRPPTHTTRPAPTPNPTRPAPTPSPTRPAPTRPAPMPSPSRPAPSTRPATQPSRPATSPGYNRPSQPSSRPMPQSRPATAPARRY